MDQIRVDRKSDWSAFKEPIPIEECKDRERWFINEQMNGAFPGSKHRHASFPSIRHIADSGHDTLPERATRLDVAGTAQRTRRQL